MVQRVWRTSDRAHGCFALCMVTISTSSFHQISSIHLMSYVDFYMKRRISSLPGWSLVMTNVRRFPRRFRGFFVMGQRRWGSLAEWQRSRAVVQLCMFFPFFSGLGFAWLCGHLHFVHLMLKICGAVWPGIFIFHHTIQHSSERERGSQPFGTVWTVSMLFTALFACVR